MEASLTMFDLGVVAVIGLSALLSFFRGFMREVTSLGAWIAAALVTLRFMAPVSEMLKPHMKNAALANGVAAIGLFLVTLLVVTLVIGLVLKMLKPALKIGLVDNLLGLAFGVARGALIVAIAYGMLGLVLVEEDYPDMVAESISRPYVARAAKWVTRLTPGYLDALAKSEDAEEAMDGPKKSFEGLVDRLEKKSNPALRDAMEQLNGRKPADAADSDLPSIEDLQQRMREENGKP